MADEKSDSDFDASSFLRTLTTLPGVYRMLDAKGGILYVGKARNLKQRVSSYFRQSGLATKTRALMQQMSSVEVTVTHTEAEALILENNLIKAHRPRYNVLLRDDKSYPFIYLSFEDDYPRLALHRGRGGAKAGILVRIQMPAQYVKACMCCRKCFGSGSVRTVSSVIVPGLVFSTRSSVVLRPVWV